MVLQIRLSTMLDCKLLWAYHPLMRCKMLTITSDTQSIADFDGALGAFFSACVANSSNCVLAETDNATAEGLADSVDILLQDLKFNPVPVQVDGKEFLQVTYELVKGIIFGSMYNAANFPLLAVGLQGLLEQDYETFLEFLEEVQSSDDDNNALYGIRCGDQAFRSEDLEDLQPYIDLNMATSSFAGDVWPHNMIVCARWKLAAKERYSGDFKVKTNHPVMLIGNTYDPVTPLVAARNISAGLQDSVVLQQNSTGVSTLGRPTGLFLLTQPSSIVLIPNHLRVRLKPSGRILSMEHCHLRTQCASQTCHCSHHRWKMQNPQTTRLATRMAGKLMTTMLFSMLYSSWSRCGQRHEHRKRRGPEKGKW